jgi:outer membrane protein W
MKKTKIYLLLFTALLFTAASVFAGGGKRNGTAGASQLIIPVGARGIAMGGATLTNSYGIESLHWNPANLSRSTSPTSAMFSHMSHIADIGVNYGAIATNIEGLGNIGFSIKSLAIGEIEETTVQSPDGTGSLYTPSYMTIGLTYSKLLSDRISVGLTGKYISESLPQVSATGIAFDVGITYNNLGMDGLNIAIVIKNLGPQMSYEGSGLNVQATVASLTRPQQFYKIEAASFELPTSLEMGVGYNYTVDEFNSFEVAGTYLSNNFWGDELALGGEYAYNDLIFLRGGYKFAPDLESDFNTYGLTAGLGFKYAVEGLDLKVDYAYREVEFFDANHVFALSLGF